MDQYEDQAAWPPAAGTSDVETAGSVVIDLTQTGNRIGAIYALHEETGAGFRAAAATVEAIQDALAGPTAPGGIERGGLGHETRVALGTYLQGGSCVSGEVCTA